jgi:hypothetical protein
MAENKSYQFGPVLTDRIINVVKRVDGMPYQAGLSRIPTRFEDEGGGGGSGSKIRIGKVTADWAFGTCATVTLWGREASSGASCKPTQTSPAETVEDVRNLSHDVKAESWVAIARATDGRWYLVEAGAPDDSETCRQTIGGQDITKWAGWDGTKVQLLGHDGNGCLTWFDTDDCQETGTGTGTGP